MVDVTTKDLRIGQVQWHCSEEDGGPDVGILVGLGGGKELWLGEMTDADDVGPVGLAVFDRRKKCEVRALDYDSIRDVIEYHVAPALSAQSTELEALRGEVEQVNDALDNAYAINKEDRATISQLRGRVAELEEAAAKVLPFNVENGPDYASVYFGDGSTHSTQAMTMNPQDWLDLEAALKALLNQNGEAAIRQMKDTNDAR